MIEKTKNGSHILRLENILKNLEKKDNATDSKGNNVNNNDNNDLKLIKAHYLLALEYSKNNYTKKMNKHIIAASLCYDVAKREHNFMNGVNQFNFEREIKLEKYRAELNKVSSSYSNLSRLVLKKFMPDLYDFPSN